MMDVTGPGRRERVTFHRVGMEDRRSDHQLVAEASMRSYNFIVFQIYVVSLSIPTTWACRLFTLTRG